MEPQENNKQSTHTEPITTPEPIPKMPKPAISIAAAIITGAAMIALALVLVINSKGSTASVTTGTSGTAAQATTQPSTPTSVPATIATLRASDTDHIRGDAANAQVLIIEYSDSDCPFCEQFHPTLQQVVNDYKGKVAWVYRYFPLDIHPDTHNEAVALQCVGQIGGAKAFNGYLDTVINITLTVNAQTMKTLGTFAQQQGIDPTKFATCVADPATGATIDASSKEAQAIGAQGTPFSIAVNIKTGKQIIIPGAYPLATFEKDIHSLFK
jgi:protein-disulfide isomerase